MNYGLKIPYLSPLPHLLEHTIDRLLDFLFKMCLWGVVGGPLLSPLYLALVFELLDY